MSRAVGARRFVSVVGIAILAVVSVGSGSGSLRSAYAAAAPGAANVIATYRTRIPQLMTEQHIPGLAVALVDRDHVLWAEGFGHVDDAGSASVDADTIFSVQSMSKLFTATAVMRAVQDGRLALDKPITTYIPDFRVHSAFEARPERLITLRMLLSHTAGFTHEAPVGNNDELDPGAFDQHVQSISDTWLRYPVGTGYAYSNLGIDVAGYILERTYGKPYAAVLRDLVLGPIGMEGSTFDRTEIRARANRAIGHSGPIPSVPVDVPMMAAGGLYTSAADLARFLRFQLNDGSVDGQAVLDPAMLEEMRTVPAPRAGAAAGYALGVVRHRWYAAANTDLFDHGGGGFGFLSDLWWAPQLQVGITVLTNSSDHHLQGDLALSILRDVVQEPGSAYQDRLITLPPQVPAPEPDGGALLPADLSQQIAGLAISPTSDQTARWASYAGDYKVAAWGVINPTGDPERFVVDGGVAYFDGHDQNDTARRHLLTEVRAGVFLADNGETLDFTGPVPTWRNFELVRITGGPAPWQWAILAVAAAVAAWWLLATVAAAVRGRRRALEPSAPATDPGAGQRMLRRLCGLAAAVTAVLVLGTVALVAAIPGLVDSGFVGWLDLPIAQRMVLHLPLALAITGICLVVLLVTGVARRWLSARSHRRDSALVVATVVVTGQLAAWHLIGWGLT